MSGERESKAFEGTLSRNPIVERIRKEGYYSLLFSKTDFMDGVVWASNLVNDFKKFYRPHRDRIVIPIDEMSFRKDDLVNAHFLMVFYYKMKKNLVLVEEIKEGLLGVAKFQSVVPEDIEIMKRWDKQVSLTKQKQESGDRSALDNGSLRGTEIKYERYSGIVAREIAKFQEELTKL